MRIRMTEARTVSPDGIEIVDVAAGDELDVANDTGARLVARGLAEEIVEIKSAGASPEDKSAGAAPANKGARSGIRTRKPRKPSE